MSFQLMAWAAEQTTGSPTRKAVLMALANRANHDTRECFPSKKRIAEEAEISVPTVTRALKDLVDGGFIEVVKRKRDDGSQASNLYRFPDSANAGEGDHSDTGEGSRAIRGEGVTAIPHEPGTTGTGEVEPVEHPRVREVREEFAQATYDPVKGKRVDGQDLAWNALAAATSAYGSANGSRMRSALASIRELIWEEFTRSAAQYQTTEELRRYVQTRWREYEDRVAALITQRATAIIQANPSLTYGPEGIARNWTRGSTFTPDTVERVAAAAVDLARLGDDR